MEQPSGQRATAVFAGGCFWCIEHAFAKLDGVISVVPGYIGGSLENPTYNRVAQGNTGHREAVLITYDPSKVAYTDLLERFWRQIDPTDDEGQFADRGSQYRTAIFTASEQERQEAEASKQALEESGKFSDPIVTEILASSRFWIAEDEHHEYAKSHPFAYKAYYEGSGRGAFCRSVWR